MKITTYITQSDRDYIRKKTNLSISSLFRDFYNKLNIHNIEHMTYKEFDNFVHKKKVIKPIGVYIDVNTHTYIKDYAYLHQQKISDVYAYLYNIMRKKIF